MDIKATTSRCNCSNEQIESCDPVNTYEREGLEGLCTACYNITWKCKKNCINLAACIHKPCVSYFNIDYVYKLMCIAQQNEPYNNVD